MNKRLYLITILFFSLGLFNILFAWVGLICFILPFIILQKDKKKTWCQSYCPRASLLTKVNGKKKFSKPTPAIFRSKGFKNFVLYYFVINLFFAFMSTIMVILGNISAIDKIRLFILFQLPWELPQLINLPVTESWWVHTAFRVYSIMLSSTLIGLVLGYFYKPRTWCAICPVGTLSDKILSVKNQTSTTIEGKVE